jgi:EmrB/QacA subfamily drug resistance transporter
MPESAGDRPRDPRLIAVVVASALFMQNLDSTAVATALPAMARDFGEVPARLGTAVTSYLVALTVFIPASGWVAERFGARRVFMAAILVFTLASALCGLAQGVGSMIAARVLQGMGGAMMVPVGRLLLLRRVKKEELITATTWLTMPAVVGPLLGPPLGGLLTDTFSWRAVFWINLPVGLLGIALVAALIPHSPPEDPGPADAPGLALSGICLALLMFGLETAGRGVVPGWAWMAALLGGLVFAALTARHSLNISRPAVELRLLAIPSFSVPVLAGTLFRIGAGAMPFLIALTLQVGFGISAAASGLVALASALGAFLMKPLVRQLLRRFGFRGMLAWNGVLAAAGVAVGALFTPTWPLWVIFVLLLLGGMSRSLQFTAMNALAYADVPPNRLAAATSLYGTMQQLSLALGVVVASTVLEFAAHLGGRGAATLADFHLAFLVTAGFTLLGALDVLRLRRDTGADVSGHRP